MNTSFLEWLSKRILKESIMGLDRNAMGNMGSVDLNQKPQRGDIVISNPSKIRKSNTLQDKRLNTHTVSGFDEKGEPITASLKKNLRNKHPQYIDVTDLFPAFADGGLGKERGTRIFSLGGNSEKFDRWASEQVNDEKIQNIQMSSILGGNQLAGDELNKQADQELANHKAKLNAKIKSWVENPVAYLGKVGMSLPEIVRELQSELKNIHEDPNESAYIDRVSRRENLPYIHSSWIDKVDPLHPSHSTKESDPFAVQVDEPVDNQGQDAFDMALQRNSNPLIDPIAANAAGQFSGQHKPEEPEEWRKLFSASYDPTIIGYGRYWKRHNDIKSYSYYPE